MYIPTPADIADTASFIESEDFAKAFAFWKDAQSAASEAAEEDTTPSPEELQLGEPIQLAEVSSGDPLFGLLMGFLEDAFNGEQVPEDELAHARLVNKELERSLDKQIERTHTLQVILSTVYLDLAAVSGAVNSGDAEAATAALRSAQDTLLAARLGKFHFHIAE